MCDAPAQVTTERQRHNLAPRSSERFGGSSRVSANAIAMPSTKTLRAIGRPGLRNAAPRATVDRNIYGRHEPYADWLIGVAASPVLSNEDAFSSTPATRRRRFKLITAEWVAS